MSLPEKFNLNMKELLKDEYESFMSSYNEESKRGVRVNILKTNNMYMKQIFPSLKNIKWCENGFYFDEEKLTRSPFYNAGLFYIQEPSAMAPVSFLPIMENDRVLDLCSAPGGKACQIAGKLNNTGVIVANDISPSRCKAIIKNFEQQGVKNGIILSDKPENLVKSFKGYFNKILVDAPCSGEGMFRKDKKVMSNWTVNSNDEYSIIQKEILNYARDMLTDGGMIMYSTCTFSKKENEEVIENFLNENLDFSLCKIDVKEYGFTKGFGNEKMEKCIRLLPHKIDGEGHFFALLQKSGEYLNEKHNQETINCEEFNNFSKEYLNLNIKGRLIRHENSLFINNIDLPNLKKIRIMKSGFYLGDVKNKKFIPSQAFAMTLKKQDFKNSISFDEEDDNLLKYLKGETIFADVMDGYVLICLNDFPIGFGISTNGKIKNKYSMSFILN